jgi:hypothetical protein
VLLELETVTPEVTLVQFMMSIEPAGAIKPASQARQSPAVNEPVEGL